MKTKSILTVTAGVCWLLAVGVVSAQERVPSEQAQQWARLMAGQVAKLTDAQVKTDVAPDKAYAVNLQGQIALVIPDKKLSADMEVGEEVMPVGQLWFKGIAPAIAGKVAPDDRLRIVPVTFGGADLKLPLCFLGVRKKGLLIRY